MFFISDSVCLRGVNGTVLSEWCFVANFFLKRCIRFWSVDFWVVNLLTFSDNVLTSFLAMSIFRTLQPDCIFLVIDGSLTVMGDAALLPLEHVLDLVNLSAVVPVPSKIVPVGSLFLARYLMTLFCTDSLRFLSCWGVSACTGIYASRFLCRSFSRNRPPANFFRSLYLRWISALVNDSEMLISTFVL